MNEVGAIPTTPKKLRGYALAYFILMSRAALGVGIGRSEQGLQYGDIGYGGIRRGDFANELSACLHWRATCSRSAIHHAFWSSTRQHLFASVCEVFKSKALCLPRRAYRVLPAKSEEDQD